MNTQYSSQDLRAFGRKPEYLFTTKEKEQLLPDAASPAYCVRTRALLDEILTSVPSTKLCKQDRFGNTALHYFAKNRRKTLLATLANRLPPEAIAIRNLQGQTPLDLVPAHHDVERAFLEELHDIHELLELLKRTSPPSSGKTTISLSPALWDRCTPLKSPVRNSAQTPSRSISNPPATPAYGLSPGTRVRITLTPDGLRAEIGNDSLHLDETYRANLLANLTNLTASPGKLSCTPQQSASHTSPHDAQPVPQPRRFPKTSGRSRVTRKLEFQANVSTSPSCEETRAN